MKDKEAQNKYHQLPSMDKKFFALWIRLKTDGWMKKDDDHFLTHQRTSLEAHALYLPENHRHPEISIPDFVPDLRCF